MPQTLHYSAPVADQRLGAGLSGRSPAAAGLTTPPAQGEEIQTRFGGYRIDQKQVLEAPRGLPGFPAERRFALLELPDQRMGSFRLLQSLNDQALSFIVAPIPEPEAIYDTRELNEIRQAARVPQEDILLLAIVTIRPAEGGGVALSVNLRAPLVVDSLHREARQHVLSATKLPVRAAFTGWEALAALRD